MHITSYSNILRSSKITKEKEQPSEKNYSIGDKTLGYILHVLRIVAIPKDKKWVLNDKVIFWLEPAGPRQASSRKSKI